MAAIAVAELSKTFRAPGPRPRRHIEAVRNISFEVDQGERLAYIGPNGAGKSTSIKILTGILHPSSGDALVLGFTPWKQRKKLVRQIGTLFGQRSQLWFQLTPRQTFGLLASIYGVDAHEQRVTELGELLEAGDLFDVPVRNLSLGQRMRCELAATMLHDPRVLFLDEPTIGLDLIAKQRFRELVVRVNEERGATIFLTSHDVSDIEQVAKRVIVINHGTIIYDDRVSTMRRSLLRTKLIEVRFEQPPHSINIEGVEVVKGRELGYKLVVDTEQRSIREVLDDLLDLYHVADISVIDPPLEEIISKIYEEPRV
ncbi:MAG TPA: ATP-binding cassette domain-containing protein [Actinomycetota bacterium]|nr:ATP-binding cassette domain-containing protein [Actinomycetota bacterium]